MNKQLSVFNFSIANQNDEAVDVNVDGYIVDSPTQEVLKDWYGDETSVSFKSFRDSIPAGIKTLNIKVNSGGGHVGDAMAMHDYMAELENNGVTVNRLGTGIVASAGTYLVMGNNSSLSENCLFMIHEVSGSAYGDVTSMENQVKAMRKFNDTIVDFYSKKTGLSSTVIGNMMKAETWMNASEAKEKGFVQSVGAKATLTNTIKPEHWPYRNIAMLNTYNSFITPINNNIMDTTKITEAIQNGFAGLLNKLGLGDKLADENVKTACNDFAASITNAIKEIPQFDEETVKNMVNTAVTDASKNFVTKEDVQNTLDTSLKNVVNKEDLNTAVSNLKTAVVEKLGNQSGGNEGGKKNETSKVQKNKYSSAVLWNEE